MVMARRVTYIPPDTDSPNPVPVRIRVTARVRGDGTRTLSGSEDTSTAIEEFTVTRVPRPLILPISTYGASRWRSLLREV